MEVVKSNVYKSLKRNNLVVWGSVVCSGIISLFAIWSTIQASKNADRFIYSISSDQKLLPLEQIEKQEVRQIFKQAHVKLFLEKFYAYDQFNYKRNIEKALWLIDSEGMKLYEFYKQQGHFNRMIQTASSQSVLQIEPVFDDRDNFQVRAIIEINKVNQEKPKRYLLVARGTLNKTHEDYPKNPYGYMISDYKEISKKPISDEQ